MGDASSGALSLDRGDPQATLTGTCCNPGVRHALHHRQHSRPRQAGAGAEAGGPRQCPSRARFTRAHAVPGAAGAASSRRADHSARRARRSHSANGTGCHAPKVPSELHNPRRPCPGRPVAPPGGAVVLRPGARRDVISERALKGKSQLREFSGWHICCSIPEIVPQRSGYLLYSHRQDDKLERTVTISLCELPPLF